MIKLPIEPRTLSLLGKISQYLTGQGASAYLTGGFVRDALLGRDTADIDIALATDAPQIAPGLAAALGGRYILLDEANRVCRIAIANHQAPSATGWWQIDLTTIKDDIEHDLGRRDFTVDAMAIELGQTGVPLIDPFGGGDDLRRGAIRAVSETAFSSDAIRLLRAVRLAAELGFTIEGETESLIRRHSHLIGSVAAERIREELVQLLAQGSQFLRYLDTLGLLTAIIPELAVLKGVAQPPEHFWDVFDHSVETVGTTDFLLRQGEVDYAGEPVQAAVPWSEALAEHFAREVSRGSTRRSLLKLAALLHDIAKPQTKAIQENGRVRFLGHAGEGAQVATSILERLRFSTKEIRLVETAVRHHLRPVQMSHAGLPTRRAIYRYFRDTGDAGIDTLFLSLADHLAARGPRLDPDSWQEHARIVGYVLEQRFPEESVVRPPKLISGHDLLNTLGLSPGPRIGELLESVREAQAAGEVTTREQALDYARQQLPLTGQPAGDEQ